MALSVGEPVPRIVARVGNTPRYVLDSVGGHYVALLFYGVGRDARAAAALAQMAANRDLFDDDRACFFGVTVDPADEARGLAVTQLPGIRHFLDFDLAVSRAFGRIDDSGGFRPGWVILDPTLRVMASFGLTQGEAAIDFLRTLPPPERHAGAAVHAPVLVVPRVFEPALCRLLVELYETHGGEQSGFMREVDGRTVPVLDASFKRRADHQIADAALRQSLSRRISTRLLPEIAKAFQFTATRMERYIVACYDAADGGHFRAHRDNTTKGTAHRRFAVTINLNAGDYEGGDLRFPEYGPRRYRAPTGGAVVFSCGLLHEALPVTRGRRYAFLPFLYDDAAAAIREANNAYLDERVGAYAR